MKLFNKICGYSGLIGILIVSWVIAKLFCREKNIWLICERGYDARDNGYWMYKYLSSYHPEIKAKFLISKMSIDAGRFDTKFDNLVWYKSFNNYLAFWNAKYIISTHIGTYIPETYGFIKLDRILKLTRRKKVIFLQHGIIKDYLPQLFGNRINVDIFCCGAYDEYEYVKKNFGHGEGVVRYTGLCRFDNLNDFQTVNQILLMPTWRKYINKETFEESEYFRTYASLLESSQLHTILNQNHIKLIFYPHFEVQTNIECFRKLKVSKEIVIASYEYDVQQLLKTSKLLITDYSSVYFDMAYMMKPVINYQFDKERYYHNHYQKGYITGEAFGPVIDTEEGLILEISRYIDSDFQVEDKYLKKSEQFFRYKDNNNCERVFNAIISL